VKRTTLPALALLFAVLLLGCVADHSLATTPVAPPTQTRPAVAPAPNLTPVQPPAPLAPAAGTYFGQINSVDVPASTVTFTASCLGADRNVMRELSAADKAPRIIPLLPTTSFTVFTSPPGNPAAGRTTPVDLASLPAALQASPGARWFMVVNPQGVATIEHDSGVRPAPGPDEPCPRG
jgi:hypothetical protein